jgi:hypothetical protein
LVSAVLLFVAASTLRWWNQIGVEAVRRSLRLGAIPLTAGVAVQWAGLRCETPPHFATGELVCLLAALIAGGGTASWAVQMKRDGFRAWQMALLVTLLTATLGCAGLGIAALSATLATLALSSTLGWFRWRHAPTEQVGVH